MGATRGASSDRYDAAAYDLFVARGAQRLPTVGSLSSVATAIGASRSQLYRHWETAADLDRDVTAHLATRRLGWMHHLDLDPEEPFGRAVARLLAGPGLCSGAAIWPAIAAEPPGSPLRHRVGAFERQYLHRLAGHLERTCPVTVDHEVPWTDLAVAVAALLHGAACSWAVLRSAPQEPVDDELQDLLVDIVTDLHGRFARQVGGPDVPLAEEADDDARPLPDGAVRLLDRIADAIEAAEVGLDPGERRLVSVDDLARSLDVTPRHLFERWPTAVDMNLAIAGEGFARLLDGFDRLTQHHVDSLAEVGAPGPGERELVEHQARQVDPDVYPEAHQLLAIVAAAADPSLAPAAQTVFRSLLFDVAPRAAAASLLLTGRRLRPGRSLFEFTVQSGVKNIGCWVELGLHPSVLGRRVTYAGEQLPAAGVSLHLMPGALIEDDAGPPGGTGREPRVR